MTTVVCNDHNCKFNKKGFCSRRNIEDFKREAIKNKWIK